MKNVFDEKTEGFYQGLQWVLDNLKLSEENEQTLKSILAQNDVEEWRDAPVQKLDIVSEWQEEPVNLSLVENGQLLIECIKRKLYISKKKEINEEELGYIAINEAIDMAIPKSWNKEFVFATGFKAGYRKAISE